MFGPFTVLDPDRIPALIAAMMLTMVFGLITGPFTGNANPLFWQILDALLGNFGDRINKPHRSRGDLAFRGFLILVLALFAALLLEYGLRVLIEAFPYDGVARVLALSMFLAGGSTWHMLFRLYKTMETQKSGEGAYYAIARSSRLNLAAGDQYGVARTALGFSASSFEKGMVAPAFWYVVFGFPALVLYSALAFFVWRFGKRGFTKGFADIAQGLEYALGALPSLLAAFFLTLASMFTPTARVHRGILSWFGRQNRAPYAQGGMPLSALAWSLNVTLGGAVQDLSGSGIKGEWVGPPGVTAQIDHRHIRRALYISVVAFLVLNAGLLAGYAGLDFLPQRLKVAFFMKDLT